MPSLRITALTAATAVLAVAPLALTACGGDAVSPTATPGSAAVSTPASALTIDDAWVKTADKGMSAAFGTLVNHTGTEINIVSGTTPSSPMVELHEVVGMSGDMKMQPVRGGFTVPAGGRLELRPGGFHLMLMDVRTPIKPGDQVAFTLTLKDGNKIGFTALGKAFNGGNENYKPGDMSSSPSASASPSMSGM
ncbi:MAG: copper chaperone PCu(A)C [Streptosporangiaceae bacterium]